MAMNKICVFILTFSFLISFFSCGQSYKEKEQISRAQQAELARADSAALKIATVPTMDCLPIFLAIEDSAFAKAGLNVHIRRCNAQLDEDTLIAGGHVEGFVTDLFRAERLQRHGTPLKYIAATNAYWLLIANKKSRVREIKQLSDKMIAMTRFSATDYLSDLAIDSAKPKNDVYRIQINNVHTRLKMLLNNEIDAMLLPEPQATTAMINHNVVLMDSRNKNIFPGVIAFRASALKEKDRRRQLNIFVSVYNRMCDSINHKGVRAFSSVIGKYMGTDKKTIAALPTFHYQHAFSPRQRDVNIAKRWEKQ